MLLVGIFWLVTTVLTAVGQGFLVPAIRLTAPGPEARRQAFALHYLLVGVWLAPVMFVPDSTPWALTIRLALFDVVLNASQSLPAFCVGKTAFTDRAINWLSARLHVDPSRLSALSRFLILSIVVGWYLLQ